MTGADTDSTKAGRLYAELKEEILRGQLKPGSVLDEATVAGAFKVSRTPVREALRRLAADGLLVPGPRRQMLVVDVPQDRRNENHHPADFALEGAAATRACQRHTPDDLDALRLNVIKQRRFAEAGDSDAFMALDEQLHRLLADAARLPTLSEFLEQLGAFVRLARIDRPTPTRHMLALIAEHEELLTLLEAGEPESLREALAAHIENTEPRT